MKRKDRKHQMERWSVGALEREVGGICLAV
jgi:hypothetical protein